MTKKQQRRPSARPDEILDAALEVFTAKGFASARMDDIAKKAGITKGAVYLYFPSKEKLFEELINRFAATIMAAKLAGLSNMKEDPLTALKNAIHLMLMMVTDPEASKAPRLVLAEGAKFPELAAFYREKVIEVGKASIKGLLEEGVKQGVFRPLSVEVAIRQIMGPMLAHMMLTHIFEAPLNMEQSVFEKELVTSILNVICVKEQAL